MDGEWEFAGALANCFATWHRFTGISYKYPFAEMMLGAARLASDYNGVPNASHIQDRLTDLVIYAQSIKTFGKAAAKECVITENGIAYPNPLFCNMGKYIFASNYHTSMKVAPGSGGWSPRYRADRGRLQEPRNERVHRALPRGKERCGCHQQA